MRGIWAPPLLVRCPAACPSADKKNATKRSWCGYLLGDRDRFPACLRACPDRQLSPGMGGCVGAPEGTDLKEAFHSFCLASERAAAERRSGGPRWASLYVGVEEKVFGDVSTRGVDSVAFTRPVRAPLKSFWPNRRTTMTTIRLSKNLAGKPVLVSRACITGRRGLNARQIG